MGKTFILKGVLNMKVYVLHASMFGHTEVLGSAIAEGAKQVDGVEVVFKSVDET